MFSCEFKTGGAAFRNPDTGEEDDFTECAEIIRILRNIQDELVHGVTSGSIIDLNGNKVGNWKR